MTAQLEIPDQAVGAAVAGFVERRAEVDSGLAEPMHAALEAAAPHLFVLFAERLTSDEAIERGARAYADYETLDWERTIEEDRDWYRAGTRLIAASLVPGRGQTHG